jgi:hypothetical protein
VIGRASLAALGLALILMGCQGGADTVHTGYSAAGLYNLANSYARAGKPGMAVLNYERARLLAPNDPDIEANLRHVREASQVPAESHNWLDRTALLGSPVLIAWMGVSGLMIGGVSLLFGRLFSRRRWLRSAAAIAGLALIGLTVCNAVLVRPKLHEGVVIVSGTSARVSPVPMGDALFVLPEAETVTMTAEHEGFVLVKTSAGRVGWVSQASLAPVVPHH